jgi:hypothetical protein
MSTVHSHPVRPPVLFLPTSLQFPAPLPGAERPEPYGYPLKEWWFCRPDEESLWDRFSGWRDWAVYLKSELGLLNDQAHAYRDGRHPVTGAADSSGFSFHDQLLAAVPQFLLDVWELGLNGWGSLNPWDPVSRLLLEVREGRSVRGHRSAVEAVFADAGNLAGVLATSFGMSDGVTSLRQRHARRHATHPWFWLRWAWWFHEVWDIMHMLRRELSNHAGEQIITRERLRLERWCGAAIETVADLHRAGPGFDFGVAHAGTVDTTSLANHIIRALRGYEEPTIEVELANEAYFVSQCFTCDPPLEETNEGDHPSESSSSADSESDDAPSAPARPEMSNPQHLNDGPVGDDGFRLGGRMARKLTPEDMILLRHVWSNKGFKTPLSFHDAAEAWGDDAMTDNTITQKVGRLNRRLLEQSFPLSLSTARGFIKFRGENQ